MPFLLTDRPASPKVNLGAGISRGLVLFDTFDQVRTGTALTRKRTLGGFGVYTKRGIETTSAGQAASYESGPWVFPQSGYTFAILGTWASGTYILHAGSSGSDEVTFFISGTDAKWFESHGTTSTNQTVGTVTTTPALLVATWNGATVSVYYNGRFVVSAAQSTAFGANATSLSVHSKADTSGGVVGYTRMLGVWNRPLSALEIERLYNDPFLPVRQPTQVFSVGGGGVTGTAAVTLDAFTSTASGTETISGTATPTLASFTPSASGTETMSGSAAITLDPFTSAVSGTVTVNVTGTAAITLDPFTSTATGTVPVTSGTSLILRSISTSVTTTAAQFTPGHQFLKALVRNDSGSTIYVGGPDVTTSNGFPVLDGETVEFMLEYTDELYAVAAGSVALKSLVQVH